MNELIIPSAVALACAASGIALVRLLVKRRKKKRRAREQRDQQTARYQREREQLAQEQRKRAQRDSEFVQSVRSQVNSTGRAQGRSTSSALTGMDGRQFEYFCAELLLKSGFERADVTPGSGDQGVDILAVREGVRYAIQCKNYSSPLSNAPVQEVNAGKTFYRCHVGVVMTNSTFTSGARKLAEATGVLLWDGAYLDELMAKAGMQSGNGRK